MSGIFLTTEHQIVNLIDELPWHETKRWGRRSLSKIDLIVVHQSLGSSSGGGNIEAVNRYHTTNDSRGLSYGRNWPHIAYHYAIRRNGEIAQVNDLKHITWHTKRCNTRGIGILVCGDFSGDRHMGTEEPSSEQKESLLYLLEYLTTNPDLNTTKDKIFGHNNAPTKYTKSACPGDTVSSWLVK